MNKRIIYPTDDGGVAVIIPAPEARQMVTIDEPVTKTVTIPATDDEPEKEEVVVIAPSKVREQTDEEFLDWVAKKDVPAGKPFKIVDVSDIPDDRTFRNAWEYQE